MTISETFTATLNYWGDADPSNDVSGNISYDPWWINPELTILGSNSPVINVTHPTVFSTIQAAIDDDATVDGDVITVAAGTYSEEVYIWKELTLLGPNYDKHGKATDRVSEALIQPPADAENGWFAVYTDSDNVTVKGFKIDGQYEPGYIPYGWKSVGIYAYGADNLTAENNIITNCDELGILNGGGYPGMDIYCSIKDNYFTSDSGSSWGQAIYLQGIAGTVSGNYVENYRAGIQIQPYQNASTDTKLVTGNTFIAWQTPLRFNYQENSNSHWDFTNNVLIGGAKPDGATATEWIGIRIETFYNGSVAFSGNSISFGDANLPNLYLLKEINVTNGTVDLDATLANNTWQGKYVLVRYAGRGLIKVPTFFSTIQEALAAAASGDWIEVSAGTFVETGQIVINKNIYLYGVPERPQSSNLPRILAPAAMPAAGSWLRRTSNSTCPM